MQVFINNQFVPFDDAFLHITDLSIQRGYGIFDGFRTINGIPLFLNDHLDRFFRSAEVLRLETEQSRETLRSIIYDLAERNNIPASFIRVTLTGGYSQDGYLLAEKPNLILTQSALKPRPTDWVEKGMRIITHEHVRELPQVKSINYLTGVLLQQKVSAMKADDVLYHINGDVSEFPRSNFFIVTQDDVVVTPDRNVLYGITRKKLLEMAKHHFKTEERNVTLNDIRQAKEAFATSTTKQLIPVVQIDDTIIGNGKPGKITQLLDNQFAEFCNDQVKMVVQ